MKRECANRYAGQAHKTYRRHLRDLHAIQITLGTSGQDPIHGPADRTRSPSPFDYFQFAGNEKQVHAGNTKLASKSKAVHSHHSTPGIRVAEALNLPVFGQKESL